MATNNTPTFNDMLKRYQPYELLVDSMKKKNYFWNKVNKKKGWVGGTMEIPFEGAEYSSLQFGSLTAANDVADAQYLMGTLSTVPELWGTMKFHEKDLDRHGDLEKSYLSIAPGKIEQFTSRMSERVSMMLLGDGAIAVATANGTVGGVLAVDNPQHFTKGEKIVIDDNDSAAGTYYVIGIDMGTKEIQVSATRGGAAADISAYTLAQGTKVFLPGAQAEGFTSLPSQLLSAANGGDSAIFGLTKTDSPILQAQNFSGSGYTSSNILEKLLDVYYETVKLGKGNPSEILVSFDVFKHIAKKLETNRQGVTAMEKSAGYGWRSVDIIGTQGEMKVTALRDMPTRFMYILDWTGIDFHGDKFFERKRHMNGDEFFLVRNTTGFEYLTDTKFCGDLVVRKLASQGIVHSIDPAQFA